MSTSCKCIFFYCICIFLNVPYGKKSQKYTEKNRQNNPQVTLRVTLKTHSQLGVNSDRSEYSIQYQLSIPCNPPIERLFPIEYQFEYYAQINSEFIN